jgi:hypothetical protein
VRPPLCVRACCAAPLKRRPALTTEALSSFGFQYLSETFLPLKLQEARPPMPLVGVRSRLTPSCIVRPTGRLDLEVGASKRSTIRSPSQATKRHHHMQEVVRRRE